MNAGRGIEQLIAEWLVEEAAPGAPERVLDSARRAIHRTNQRRFAALWRELMFTPARVVAMAAMLVIAVGAGAWIGRATAPIGPAAPASSPSPTAAGSTPGSGPTLETYRAARDAICRTYAPQVEPLVAQLDGIYLPETSASDRASKVAALTQIVTLGDQANIDLAAVPVPPDMAVDAAVMLARARAQASLLHQELDRLAAGDLAGAKSLDLATDPLAQQITAFEQRYGMQPCA